MDISSETTSAASQRPSMATTTSSSSNVTAVDQVDMSYPMFYEFIKILDIYFAPAVILTGLVGNTLSFIVFVCSHLKRLSSSVYLAGLAVADTGFLLCLLVSWANNIGIHIYHEPGWCQTFVYLTYIWGFLSVWYIVSFSVERYIAVCYPFKRRTMCTVKRARIVLITLAVISAVIYTFALWTSGVTPMYGTPFCATLPEHEDLLANLVSADTILTLVVPYVAIIILNTRIIVAVVQIHRQRKLMSFHGTTTNGRVSSHRPVSEMMSTESTMSKDCVNKMNSVGQCSKCSATHSNCRHSQKSKKKSNPGHHPSQMKVTKTLVVVSTIFLLLNLPSHIVRIHIFIMGFIDKDYDPGRLYRLTQKIFLHIYHLNFAINFFLYNTCGQNFRHALFSVFRNTRCFKQLNKFWSKCQGRAPLEPKRDHEATLLTQFTQAPVVRGGSKDRSHLEEL